MFSLLPFVGAGGKIISVTGNQPHPASVGLSAASAPSPTGQAGLQSHAAAAAAAAHIQTHPGAPAMLSMKSLQLPAGSTVSPTAVPHPAQYSGVPPQPAAVSQPVMVQAQMSGQHMDPGEWGWLWIAWGPLSGSSWWLKRITQAEVVGKIDRGYLWKLMSKRNVSNLLKGWHQVFQKCHKKSSFHLFSDSTLCFKNLPTATFERTSCLVKLEDRYDTW